MPSSEKERRPVTAEAAEESGRGAAYELAACGLLTTAPDGTIQRVNTTFAAWTGFNAGDLVLRRRFQDLLTMGGKLYHQTHWLPLLRLQGSVNEVQLDIVHKDGHPIPVLVNAQQRNDGQEATAVEIAVFAVHDRDVYERELLLARKKSEDLEREADQRAVLAQQLVGIVSHDLRNPLNAVLLGAHLLASSELSDGDRRTVARITSSAQRANRLIADLLDFTQARLGGQLPVEPREIDLHALVADQVEEVKLASPGRMIEHRRTGAGLGHADPDRLAQVLSNLMNNALAYGTPTEPVVVTTAVTTDTLEIRVHNTGKPIPEDIRPHIFEPLRRGEQQVRLGSRSVGLGLYITSEIAKAHGGEVHVHSTEAEGTTFAVKLPRRGR